MRRLSLIALLLASFAANADIPLTGGDAQDAIVIEPDAPIGGEAVGLCPCEPEEAERLAETNDGLFQVDPDQWSLVGAARGLSLHKPIYVYPVTYSPDYNGSETEFVFQYSAKYRLFGTNTFFGFTQRSYWQIWNTEDSRPFRETNYNPELFYRWLPEIEGLENFGMDFGIEHESNGRSVELSRSWNRVYGAVFLTRGRSLYYLKTWYRLPESRKDGEDDPRGDDNPNIYRYYGYGEFYFARQIGKQQQLAGMVRANPASGKGALELTYSIPNNDRTLFWSVRLWHGYGETLLDYNRSTTRLLLGVMLSR